MNLHWIFWFAAPCMCWYRFSMCRFITSCNPLPQMRQLTDSILGVNTLIVPVYVSWREWASHRASEPARAYTHFQLSMKYTTKLPNAKCKIRIMEIEFGVIITIICVLWLGVILIIQSHPFDAVEAYVCHLFGMWNALNVKWNVARVLWVCKIETTMNKHTTTMC